jgi:hypothetical protein
VQSIRVFRVFRIFRVIRVVRLMSISASFAFQRQVFVLSSTVLSLIFAAAGLFQIFESGQGKEYPFHKAVYYAAITVIGRPGVPFAHTITPIFLTVLACLAATVIPTFVAELIRLWFDNATLEVYKGSPEQRHVIVCGDTSVARLRALANQYYWRGRDPDEQTPIIVLAEQKPEGALKAFLEQYKHSGQVMYIRGSARRAGDLRRAGIALAKCCVVLNYRPEKEAGAADTEVLSTVMAIKNTAPNMRVLAQLARPRKRNQLKAVPGWQDGDKSFANISLGMTLLGLSSRIPGFATLVVNLIRKGVSINGVASRGIGSKALPWWYVMLYGEAAKPSALASSSNTSVEQSSTLHLGRSAGAANARSDEPGGTYPFRTPLEEYASSFDTSVYDLDVTPGLAGKTFGAAARMAYMRHGVTLLACTLPVNDDLYQLAGALGASLPRTYRTALFPVHAELKLGMRLYCIAPQGAAVERLRLETGGKAINVLAQALTSVGQSLTAVGQSLIPLNLLRGTGSEAKEADDTDLRGEYDMRPVHSTDVEAGMAGSDGRPSAAAAGALAARMERIYGHNATAVNDLSVPWCRREFAEVCHRTRRNEAAMESGDLIHMMHLDTAANSIVSGVNGIVPAFDRSGHRADTANHRYGHGLPCDSCGQLHNTHLPPQKLLTGHGIVTIGDQPSLYAPASEAKTPVATATPIATATVSSGAGAVVSGESSEGPAASAAKSSLPGSIADDGFGNANENAFGKLATPSAALAATGSSALATEVVNSLARRNRRQRIRSVGDDGLGGIDDTSDITGTDGRALNTVPPKFDGNSRIGATAAAAARANTNALAVRLALPPTAVTDVESLAVDALSALSGSLPDWHTHAMAKPSNLRGHVLILGVNDSLGFIIRAVACLIHSERARRKAMAHAKAEHSLHEGEQYFFEPSDIVVLAPGKPSEANMNAMYSGSAYLFSRVTFMTGSPSEATDLLKAGVMTARSAIILAANNGKASGGDGPDNLADDTDAVLTTATVCKLNPTLHVVTEVVHGSHASYIRPNGAGMNDAQRNAFVYILEEREAAKHRQRIDDAVTRLAVEGANLSVVPGAGWTAPGVPRAVKRTHELLAKLLKQQARLRALNPAFMRSGLSSAQMTQGASQPLGIVASRGAAALASASLAVASTNAPATGNLAFLRTADQLDAQTGAGTKAASKSPAAEESSVEALTSSGLSNSAIVDVLVGVREDFGSAASGSGNANSSGEGSVLASAITSVASGGRNLGTAAAAGASNDLFASAAYAAGRAFSLTAMDAMMMESHFQPGVSAVLKQIVRAARRGRVIALPATEAAVMARLVTPSSPYFLKAFMTPTSGANSSRPTLSLGNPAIIEVIRDAREAYLGELAASILATARMPPGVTVGAAGVSGSGAEAVHAPLYGEIYEALLRGWNLLPIGLYRRVHPASGLKTAAASTVAALQLAAGPPTPGDAFVNNRALVSYVFTNPAPDVPLSEHDLVYAIYPDEELAEEEEDEENADDDVFEVK